MWDTDGSRYTKRYEWNDEFFAGGTGDNGYLFTGWNESKTNLLTVGGELAKTIEVVRLNTKLDMHFQFQLLLQCTDLCQILPG